MKTLIYNGMKFTYKTFTYEVFSFGCQVTLFDDNNNQIGNLLLSKKQLNKL